MSSPDRHVFTRAVDAVPRQAHPHGAGSEAVGRVLAAWKGITTALLAIAALGWAGHAWESSHATKADVGAASASVQALDKRVTVVEDRVQEIKKVLDRMDAQLFEIAKATGAKTVPQP